MARKKKSSWDEIDGGKALSVPLTLLRHRNFTRLSAYSVKLLMDLCRQYTGYNNGYLCASWALMKECGWNSSHTVQKAMLELEHYRIILRTQQGGKNRPNLHAITWRNINEKKDQPIERCPTITPPDSWKHDLIDDFVMPAPRHRRRPRKALKVAA